MVVTSSREEAVRWSLAMNKYLADKGYHDMTALVAFSGKITVDGEEYTEPGMTGISEKALPQHFRESDDARVLIVADKYQTGYDEPLLCAMYVDKQLSGIAAVQTLSRLNRTAPGKPLPIVLDFRNDAQTIQDSFATYYSDAYISQETDPNALFNLADKLDLAGYYDDDQLYGISDAYLANTSGEQLAHLLAPVIHSWKESFASTEPDTPERDEVLAFRRNARAYRSAWDFLSQIIDYGNPSLHRRAILAGLLERNLHVDFVFDKIEIDTVELVGLAIAADDKTEQDYSITASEPTDLTAPSYDGDRSLGGQTREQIALAEAIDKVNEMFAASGLDLGDGSGAAWTQAAWGVLADDDEVQAMSQENTDEQLKASPKFHDKVVQALVSVATDSSAMTEAVMTNPDLKDKVVDFLATLAAVALGDAA